MLRALQKENRRLERTNERLQRRLLQLKPTAIGEMSPKVLVAKNTVQSVDNKGFYPLLEDAHLKVEDEGIRFDDEEMDSTFEWLALHQFINSENGESDEIYATDNNGEGGHNMAATIDGDLLVIQEIPDDDRYLFKIPKASVNLLAEHYLRSSS